MTHKEALRLALEALKSKDGWGSSVRDAKEKAIAACEAALEAKDEPVTKNGLYRLGYHNGYGFGEAYGKANAPQRTWVGLTDEEFKQIMLAIYNIDLNVPGHSSDDYLLWNAIEAKLKELNQ
jgi:hypothetical protein